MNDGTCSVNGCPTPPTTRGWCLAHYTRWRRHGDPTAGRKRVNGSVAERLAAYVTEQDGHWLWTGHIGTNGYGRIRADGKWANAHRVSYEHHVGPIPEGLQIDHLCRVRHCVNPEHLEAVTPLENTRRKPSVIARRS